MNIELWKFIFQIIQAVGTVGVGIYVWWTNREKVTTTKFSGHDKRLTALETTLSKIAEADSKATKAMESLTTHKEAIAKELETIRIESSQKSLCGNHQRMEDNDTRLFRRLDQLHGDIRELCGGVKGLAKSMEVVNQHLLNGGK